MNKVFKNIDSMKKVLKEEKIRCVMELEREEEGIVEGFPGNEKEANASFNGVIWVSSILDFVRAAYRVRQGSLLYVYVRDYSLLAIREHTNTRTQEPPHGRPPLSSVRKLIS